MAVVQIVDNAEVGDASGLQALDDGDLILGLAKPATVVVQRERAADLAGLFGQGTQLFGGRLDSAFLFGSLHAIIPEVEQDPELGLFAVAFQQVEDDARLAIELAGGDPKRVKRDAVRVRVPRLRRQRKRCARCASRRRSA